MPQNINKDPILVAGVDEAGRGSLFGPLVAAAVILPPEGIEGLRDSKELSPGKREKFFRRILKKSLAWAFSLGTLEEIEEENVLRATLKAMARAIKGLELRPDTVLVDGPVAPEVPGVKTIPVIHGDRLFPQISAASIVAKVIRDRIMVKMSPGFPSYLLEKNMGYATQEHRKRLGEIGASPFHRDKFVLKYKSGPK